MDACTRVARPPHEVFAAFADDPANWGEFYPGFDKTGSYSTPRPHGVGSRCTKRVLGLRVEETVLGWDEPARYVFRVDRVTAPAFDAWVEEYRFEPVGDDATLVHFAVGCRPRVLFKLFGPVIPRAMGAVLSRAGHNLEHARRFTSPMDNP